MRWHVILTLSVAKGRDLELPRRRILRSFVAPLALLRMTWNKRMPIDDASFKLAMSHFASGVTIVTTEHEGKPYGLTVASFASLSLHPPLVLVCIEKSVKSHEALKSARKFGVSMLAESQAD